MELDACQRCPPWRQPQQQLLQAPPRTALRRAVALPVLQTAIAPFASRLYRPKAVLFHSLARATCRIAIHVGTGLSLQVSLRAVSQSVHLADVPCGWTMIQRWNASSSHEHRPPVAVWMKRASCTKMIGSSGFTNRRSLRRSGCCSNMEDATQDGQPRQYDHGGPFELLLPPQRLMPKVSPRALRTPRSQPMLHQ